MSDLHAAARTREIERRHGEGFEAVLMRLQHAKDQTEHSLHVRPSSFSTAGLQTTDLLGLIGFRRSHCTFVGGECYASAVEANFDLSHFIEIFPRVYSALRQAEGHLERCGLVIGHGEGFGFFIGQPSRADRRPQRGGGGDGHTAQKIESMKTAEGDHFRYAFSWRSDGADKGWTTHYRPRHPPLSPEVERAFTFLGLAPYAECPEFDFESCHWRFVPYREDERSVFGGNAEIAHGWFDAHAAHFATGVERLLEAQRLAEAFGWSILPRPVPAAGTPEVARVTRSTKPLRKASDFGYDVAISYAGPERPLAERLATIARDAGFVVFYDGFYPEQLWGKDLAVFFDDIYRKEARFCVMLISPDYRDRMWTTHERQSALARMLAEKGGEYILPIIVEPTELPGLRPTVGHLSLADRSIDEIGRILVEKLGMARL
jgi:hypothetical protein